jgi:hypothetical protein
VFSKARRRPGSASSIRTAGWCRLSRKAERLSVNALRLSVNALRLSVNAPKLSVSAPKLSTNAPRLSVSAPKLSANALRTLKPRCDGCGRYYKTHRTINQHHPAASRAARRSSTTPARAIRGIVT